MRVEHINTSRGALRGRIQLRLSCGETITYLPSQKTGKYCNNKCQADHRWKTITKPKFYKGLMTERKTIRKVLAEDRGDLCEICSISKWNKKPIVLQVDHVDGNAGNHDPKNVRLICPNCHSQTPQFSGRNRGNGRKSRGLSLR